MQKKSSYTKIFILVIGFVIVGGLLEFSNFIFSKSNSKNLEYIPENAILKMRIDGKKLSKKTIESLLFDSKNSNILIQLDTLIQQIRRDTSKVEKIKNSGINFNSEIGVFAIEKNGNIDFGILLNISDKDDFINNLKSKPDTYFAINNDGNVGVIGFSSNPFSKPDLKFLQKIVSKKSTYSFTDSDFENDITIETKEIKNSPFGGSSGKINCSINADKVTFNGKLKSTLPFTPTNYSLAKNGLHYTLQDPVSLKQINTMFQLLNPSLSEIKHIAINYRGVTLKEGGNPYFAEPDFDLLLSFENTIIQDSLLNFVNKFNELGFKYENGELFAGKTKFTLKLIDGKHLFIGTKSNSLVNKPNPNLVEVNGSPELLTKIKGPDYITSFFEVMTPFAATKTYLSSIESTNMTMNKSDLNGTIQFKKGKNSFLEMIRFMLILKGIQ
jgi:hypothetical protein